MYQNHLYSRVKMLLTKSFSATLLAITLSILVKAETHTVHFINKCGRGTPTLIEGSKVLSTGADFVSNGPIEEAIAYLQIGSCGFQGEGCTLIETSLINPTSPGSGSSSDISLIPPHTFSVASGFAYTNGCIGVGADCTSPDCATAFHSPDDTQETIVCLTDNVGLNITFCDWGIKLNIEIWEAVVVVLYSPINFQAEP